MHQQWYHHGQKFDGRRSVCDVILPWQKQPNMQWEMPDEFDVEEAASSLLLGTEEGKSSCGDGAVSEGDDFCKPAE
eukprot:3568094-Ditylum_brightwellii.AAC.1